MATTVAELGIGAYDGQPKLIEYATERQTVRWNTAGAVWLSEPRPALKMKDSEQMNVAGAGTWLYVSSPYSPASTIGLSGFGWTPQAIHRADAAYAAGLVLQEKLDYIFWAWSGADNLHLATVYFDLNPTDVMSTLISATAGDHIGSEVTAPVGIRRTQSTGWHDSLIPTPTKALLAPHLYSKNYGAALTGNPRLEYLNVEWRWKGDPTP